MADFFFQRFIICYILSSFSSPAEMWFGVLFAVLLELVSGSVQSTALAIFLFVMNNVGGNLPVVVDPLSDLVSYRGALMIMYPGGYLASELIYQ